MYMWLVLQEHGRGKVYLYNIQDSNIMYIRLEHLPSKKLLVVVKLDSD